MYDELHTGDYRIRASTLLLLSIVFCLELLVLTRNIPLLHRTSNALILCTLCYIHTPKKRSYRRIVVSYLQLTVGELGNDLRPVVLDAAGRQHEREGDEEEDERHQAGNVLAYAPLELGEL